MTPGAHSYAGTMTAAGDGGRAKTRGIVHSESGAAATLDLPVDPTRTYTWIPVDVALAIGLRRIGVCSVLNEQGRVVTRALAEVHLEFEGRRRPATVVLCEVGDHAALGALALEAFDLALDPRSGGVRPAETLLELLA